MEPPVDSVQLRNQWLNSMVYGMDVYGRYTLWLFNIAMEHDL